MRNKAQTILKIVLSLSVGAIVLSYVFFNTRIFIEGPKISVFSPASGESMENNLIEIKGQALNTSFISINDRPITVDDEGNFTEEILLRNGNNIIIIDANDKFNRKVSKQLELVYNNWYGR